jgi:hypothetical protein
MIFNKNDNGTDELKEVLGFIDASVSFREVKPFINKKKRILVSLISPAVYTLAEDHYKSENFNEPGQDDPRLIELDEIVVLIQTAQGAYAWHEFAPFKDLSHTSAGRRLRVDPDNEKIPSDRLLKKSDEQILQLAHSATDDLLKFMDECTTDPTEPDGLPTIKSLWRASTQYTARKGLFVSSLEEFETVFPLFGSYRMYAVLVPFLKETQRDLIKPSFATEADYNTLVAAMIAGNPSASQTLIIEKARVPMVFNALKLAAKRLSVQVLDKGIFRNVLTEEGTDAEKQPADSVFFAKIVSILAQDTDAGLKIFREHLHRLKIEADGGTYEYTPLADSVDPTKKYIRI